MSWLVAAASFEISKIAFESAVLAIVPWAIHPIQFHKTESISEDDLDASVGLLRLNNSEQLLLITTKVIPHLPEDLIQHLMWLSM